MNNDHLEKPQHLRVRATTMRSGIAALLCLTTLGAALPARATDGPSAVSEGSLSLAGGSLLVVAGSPLLLVGVPDWTIIGVETVAKGMRLTLRGAAETAVLVVMVPVAVAAAGSVVVGGAVVAVAVAGGWLLTCGGKTLGFVARESSQSLLFSEPVGGCCPRCC